MKVIELATELRRVSANYRNLAFVPTMGALHRGHASLVDLAQAHGQATLVSIFVNPTQFSPDEDFDRYPRTLEADLDLLRDKGVDYVFTPSPKELYLVNHQTEVFNNRLSSELCGETRPRHFRGVLTVVLKLLNLCHPRYLVLGKKDYQQLVLIKKMIADFYLDTEVVAAEIVREDDGLAISTRNSYLNVEQRRQASTIYRALQEARQRYIKESSANNCRELLDELVHNCEYRINEQELLMVEYAELRDRTTLDRIRRTEGAVLLVAVQIDKLRLIDNVELYPELMATNSGS